MTTGGATPAETSRRAGADAGANATQRDPPPAVSPPELPHAAAIAVPSASRASLIGWKLPSLVGEPNPPARHPRVVRVAERADVGRRVVEAVGRRCERVVRDRDHGVRLRILRIS